MIKLQKKYGGGSNQLFLKMEVVIREASIESLHTVMEEEESNKSLSLPCPSATHLLSLD